MNIKVNARGDACPIPVVKTKNAIKSMTEPGTVETLVDNEIAVQNLTKMAKQKGYGVSSEKLGEQKYCVTMDISAVDQTHTDGTVQMTTDSKTSESGEESCTPDMRKKSSVVVISSDQMGEGSTELGKLLLKGFIYALSEQDELPGTILFYNGGAKVTCEDSPSLEDLKSLQAQGVEILTCGTCLDYYGLKEKLKVGEVTNMYVIVEKMTQAGLIIKP